MACNSACVCCSCKHRASGRAAQASRRLMSRSISSAVRLDAIKELCHLHEDAVADQAKHIADALQHDEDVNVRANAAEALCRIQDKVLPSMPQLSKIIDQVLKKEGNPVVRRAASRFLALRNRGAGANDNAQNSRQLPRLLGRTQAPHSNGIQPEYWGISLQDLMEFRDEILNEKDKESLHNYCQKHKYYLHEGRCVHACLEDPCPFEDHKSVGFLPIIKVPAGLPLQKMIPNMHQVVAREIKPRTHKHGCSFALMKHPEGVKISAFITHTWDENFKDFINTLRMALDPEDVVWVCSFALDQNNTAGIKSMLAKSDLDQCPFALALSNAPKLVVTMDAELKVPTRSWCAYEIAKAQEWTIPTVLWPTTELSNLTQLAQKVAGVDVRKAQATDASDQERIHRAIQEGFGYDAVNMRLRVFLGDRIKFYQAATAKISGELAELNRQIDEARRQCNSAKLYEAEKERNNKLRIIQLEAEQKANEQQQLSLQLAAAEVELEKQRIRESEQTRAIWTLTEEQQAAREKECQLQLELQKSESALAQVRSDEDAELHAASKWQQEAEQAEAERQQLSLQLAAAKEELEKQKVRDSAQARTIWMLTEERKAAREKELQVQLELQRSASALAELRRHEATELDAASEQRRKAEQAEAEQRKNYDVIVEQLRTMEAKLEDAREADTRLCKVTAELEEARFAAAKHEAEVRGTSTSSLRPVVIHQHRTRLVPYCVQPWARAAIPSPVYRSLSFNPSSPASSLPHVGDV
eukprot:TRINITY_DN8293_c0_g5_i1.p1 TRINITY_DN8293_c0_g5~~TRINITY_DN8293_c0_g5_i1.p1  ORF type:complete len:766 (+),score=187.57 TRINITY_DN8293_c0_g5_i1:29-2299(+)